MRSFRPYGICGGARKIRGPTATIQLASPIIGQVLWPATQCVNLGVGKSVAPEVQRTMAQDTGLVIHGSPASAPKQSHRPTGFVRG